MLFARTVICARRCNGANIKPCKFIKTEITTWSFDLKTEIITYESSREKPASTNGIMQDIYSKNTKIALDRKLKLITW